MTDITGDMITGEGGRSILLQKQELGIEVVRMNLNEHRDGRREQFMYKGARALEAYIPLNAIGILIEVV